MIMIIITQKTNSGLNYYKINLTKRCIRPTCDNYLITFILYWSYIFNNIIINIKFSLINEY